MANRRTHNAAIAVVALPSAISVWIYTRDLLAAALSFGFCLLGQPLTPDLDQEGWVGPFWQPYARMIEHRHIWSHLPVLGTVGRIVYVLIVPITILSVNYRWWEHIDIALLEWVALWAFVGLTIADTTHWVLDGFPLRV